MEINNKKQARSENSARSISIRRECMNSSSSNGRPGDVGRQLGSRFPSVPRRFLRAMNCLMFSNKSQLREAAQNQTQCVRSRWFLSFVLLLFILRAHTSHIFRAHSGKQWSTGEKKRRAYIFFLPV